MDSSVRRACNSCCEACSASSRSASQDKGSPQASPFAFQYLFPAGTIHFHVVPDATPGFCNHTHAEDGWHPFLCASFLPCLTHVDDNGLCGEIDFLIKHHFIAATYRTYD